jgi:hypothetical protein
MTARQARHDRRIVLYTQAVRRLALILLLAFLTCDLSGLDSFLTQERCTAVNDVLPDNDCPPTCVRCACCAQPVVGSTMPLLVQVAEPQVLTEPQVVHIVAAPPHDILHIPKTLSLIA